MKAVQTLHTAMSDVFRAYAGDIAAQTDMIANVVYTAAYHVMLANNKTQFNKLAEDAKMYGGDTTEHTKAIKAALGLEKVTPVVKHFRKVYFSLAVALDQCGIPDMVPDVLQGKAYAAAQFAVLDTPAQDYAAQFASIFFATLTMPEKTAAEKEAAASVRAENKAKKEKLAAKELQQTIKSEATAIAMRDSVKTVIALLQTGTLSADDEAALIDAVRTRETAVLLARVAAESHETESA